MPSHFRTIGLAAAASLVIGGFLPASTSASPTTSEKPTASAAESQSRSGARAEHGHRTLFGTTVDTHRGESYGAAFDRKQRTYGRLGVVRTFFPGLPQRWSAVKSNTGDTRLVVSFRVPPAQVLSGRYDRELRQWFADAPRNHVTRWSYWHEPEDDAERGALRPDAYRQAWRHIDALARSAHNPKLRSTLILMCWTVNSHSGRDWRDFYPGARTIDVMAFDCYSTFTPDGNYRSPGKMIGPAYRLSKRLGEDFGIAELGTVKVRNDYGRGRAQWLHQCARWLRHHDAHFVSYFDTNGIALNDAPSRSAWRKIVTTHRR